MEALAVVLVFIGLIGLYIGSYYLNKNTAVPEGTIEIEGCGSCASSGSCSIQSAKKQDDCEIHTESV